MIVRSHLPWPLRWALVALMLGFSAALALWAFEFGKQIAGLERGGASIDEVVKLRDDVAQLRSERDKAQLIADTSSSLLKTERAAQEGLASQLRQLEAENMSIKADLGFFERLLPVGPQEDLAVRGFQVEQQAAGDLRYQLLVMQNGKSSGPFSGRYALTLKGTLTGKSWTFPMPGGPLPLQIKQYVRVEGHILYPADAVVQSVEVSVLSVDGKVRASQSTGL